jgi:hypothetical protein
MDQLAANAAGRNNSDLARLAGLWVAHGDDGLDAVIPGLGNGTTDCDGLGANRDAADIGIDVDPGNDAAVAGQHRSADLLPVVAIPLANHLGGGSDEIPVLVGQDRSIASFDSRSVFHFASSLRPRRISCATSAF